LEDLPPDAPLPPPPPLPAALLGACAPSVGSGHALALQEEAFAPMLGREPPGEAKYTVCRAERDDARHPLQPLDEAELACFGPRLTPEEFSQHLPQNRAEFTDMFSRPESFHAVLQCHVSPFEFWKKLPDVPYPPPPPLALAHYSEPAPPGPPPGPPPAFAFLHGYGSAPASASAPPSVVVGVGDGVSSGSLMAAPVPMSVLDHLLGPAVPAGSSASAAAAKLAQVMQVAQQMQPVQPVAQQLQPVQPAPPAFDLCDQVAWPELTASKPCSQVSGALDTT